MIALMKSLSGQFLVALFTALFSIAAYWHTKRRELSWKRTEFLFEQSEYFDNDPILIEVVTILEDRDDRITVNRIFDRASELDEATRRAYLQKFDKLLNFLWRLCYACLETKMLSLKEIEAFGWFLWRISELPLLAEYCDNYGFDEINIVIKKLKPVWEKADREEADV